MTDRQVAAFHEAGHVVVAWHFRIPVTEVSILPWGDRDGHYRFQGWHRRMFPGGRARRRAIAEAMMMLGGEAAQSKHNPRSLRWWHAIADLTDAWTTLSYLCHDSDETDVTFASLKLEVRRMMDDRAIWENVNVLASALLDAGKLSGRRLARLH